MQTHLPIRGNAPNALANFPAIQSKDLNGRELSLPQDFPGERTILLVAFQREQQTNVDSWTAGLHLAGGKAAWLELPVIDDPGALARWFINGGMRRGIKDHDIWAHVVTLYTTKAKFNAALGIQSEKQVQALVVDRQGRILERVVGDYSEAGAARIQAALQPQ